MNLNLPDMKKKRNYISYICAAVAILLTACTADPSPVTGKSAVTYPELQISVSEMTLNAVTRAADPMSPDVEKYVRTIAVFEFDNEGLHENSSSTYHFIDFVAGTVDGKTSDTDDVHKTDYGIVETTLKGIALNSYPKGTLCLVANITEAQVDTLYEKYREEGQTYGRITFEKFKTWALPFEYEEEKKDTYDETVSGHIKSMYMFGYYQGDIDASATGKISIDLGRLASRLDITVVNETGEEITKRLGYHFDNVCKSAYFFPIKMSMPPIRGAGTSRTVICSGEDTPVEGDKNDIVPEKFPNGGSHTRYFYAAAHSAKNEDEATKLHLFYNSHVLEDDKVDDGGLEVKIPLCNVHPSQAASIPNGYSLSRNTRYHFTIRLKSIQAKTKSDARSVVYEDRPGEITVYLPSDK